MDKNLSTLRVSKKSLAFFSTIRKKKTLRFGVKYTNNIVVEEMIAILEDNPELIEELVKLSPGATVDQT